MTFINLHKHSRWSLQDGAGSGDQYAERAAALGQPAMALTDHGTLAGMLEHLQSCEDAGIMPICGIEVYYRVNRRDHTQIQVTDPATGKVKAKQPRFFHLTLLAKNWTGWLNLQRLVSESYQSGYYYKPTIDFELAARYSEGIYCLLGCMGGYFANLITVGHEPDVVSYVQQARSIWGNNLSVEIMPHDFDEQRVLNINQIRVANEFGLGIAATGDTHTPFKDWSETQRILFRMALKQSNTKLAEQIAKKKAFDQDGSGEDIKIYTQESQNPTLYLMSEEEMVQSFLSFHPQIPPDMVDRAVSHTGEIIQDFVPFLLDRQIKMPSFSREVLAKIEPMTAFEDPEEDTMVIVKSALKRWVKKGLDDLEKLYPAEHWLKYPRSQYEADVEKEYEIFHSIGDHVWRYMLMAGGEVRWAKSENISVGAGRGSAAGSRIAYLIGITEIDPLPYDLMTERFINPNRKGMPDIDIDFMPGPLGRDRVKDHTSWVYNEHGANNVIDIAAYGTYGPKGALRAICRIYDDEISFVDADRYVKVLDILKPTERIDLEECAEKFPEIAEFKRKYPHIWKHAVRVEGHPYTVSKHASGVLVKPTSVEVVTQGKRNDDTGEMDVTTAWPDTRELLANYGFLKLDYLVIDGLVRQYEILQALRDRENTPINLRELPVRWDPDAVDPKVMEIFKKAMTLGIWQMEGGGTTPVLKAVSPDNMHDIAAINALIRPGSRAAGDTEMYAKLKHGIEPITYWHDAVEPALKKTYGLMVYQEQVMEVAVQLGGFTRTEADDLRKAMGKKYREGMAVVIKFLDKLGFGPKFLHHASFMVGEESANDIWQKTIAKGGYSFNASHAYAYGLISYHDAVLKEAAPADFYAGYLSQAKSKDLPKKLAASMREGSRFGTKIMPPNINRSGRNFTVLDKKTILYGLEAVSGVGPAGVSQIETIRPFHSYKDFDDRMGGRPINKNGKKALIGAGAFDEFGLRAMMNEKEKASNEDAYIGVRLSGKSVMDQHSEIIESTAHTEDEFDAAPHGEFLCIGGEVIAIKHTQTKAKGEAMGFVTVAYGADTVKVTCFPKTWSMYQSLFQVGNVLFFNGRKDISDTFGPGFIGQECITLEDLLAQRGIVLAA